MINCFGSVRSGQNIIRLVRGLGHKTHYFSIQSVSGQKITGHFVVGIPKTLPRRTLVPVFNSIWDLTLLFSKCSILYTDSFLRLY